MPEPQQTSQDQQQFTHVALDEPSGATVTQSVDNSSAASQHTMQLPPVVAPPFMPPVDYSPAQAEETPQPDELHEQIQTARSSQDEAKLKAESALKQVQQIEEKTKQSEADLAQQAAQAQKQAAQAKKEIEKATEKQKEVEKTLKEAKADSGPSVAGYKPFDFIKALNSPPRPADAGSWSEPSIDKDAQKQLQKQLKEVKQETRQSKTKVDDANQQVERAKQVAQKAKQRHENILQKISQQLDSFAGQAAAADSQSYKAFLIIGAVCLAIALLSVPFTSAFVWIVFMLVAFVQLGMGTMLKKKSQ